MGDKRVAVVNLGCRVNRVESDRFIAELHRAGFEMVDERDADVIVINTCAVTGEAESKTRKAVRHALKMPLAPMVVATGCAVNLNPGAIAALSDRVVVEPSKLDVPRRVEELLPDRGYSSDDAEGHGFIDLLGRSRLGVKIQDGCNHRCTYCIVWKARGPERSVPVGDVVGQVRSAAEAGVPEIVLTGVNLGAYCSVDGGSTIGIDGLVERLLADTSIPQIRLSSIEPMDVTRPMIDCMASSSRIAPFLHLPLQSGCDSTLHRMARPYTSGDFLELVHDIRRSVPSVSLSCDIIVGFPGETEEEFEESLETCRAAGFSRMHVFRYSKRPGTPAAAARDQVPPSVMARRSAQMRALASELALEDSRRRVGSVETCVLESGHAGTLASFHHVEIDGPCGLSAGSLARVAIDEVDRDGVLHGHLCDR